MRSPSKRKAVYTPLLSPLGQALSFVFVILLAPLSGTLWALLVLSIPYTRPKPFLWPGILIIFSIDLFFPSFHGTTAHYFDDADDGLVYATRISFFFCGFLGTGMVQKDGFG